jgi:hypothetical protein
MKKMNIGIYVFASLILSFVCSTAKKVVRR